MSEKIDLSVVIPAYNEEKNTTLLYKELKLVLESLSKNYEIIFVDDGSTDITFEELKKLHEKDNSVKILQFQRNFGKSAALLAGFDNAKGDIIITMDADLQDEPEEIPRFIDKIKEGYDVVIGWKFRRKDPISKKLISKLFNFFVRNLFGISLHDVDCNFRAMKREVVNNLKIYSGFYRYIPVFAKQNGYSIGEIKIKHNPRRFGKSKYGISRLYNGFFDLITVKFITTYFKRPLHFFGSLGSIFTGLGFILGLFLLYEKYVRSLNIGTRPLLILTILLIMLGVQFISIGLVGEMVTHSKYSSEEQYTIKKRL